MKLDYHPETDRLYIEPRTAPSSETLEIADGFNADLDAEGRPVG